MTARIVVAHAGRQHSHQLAAALHARGALHEYWTGLPMNRSREVEVPADRVHVLPLGSTAHVVERYLPWGRSESVLGQLGDYATDNVFAYWLRRASPTAIVGYENASFATFQAARERGILTVLDAASVHHAAADRWMGASAGGGWASDVRRHKDAELALADHVLVLSELARETYVAAGVPAARVHVVPLGYDPRTFRPAAEARVGEPLRFVFVGNTGHRKGFDVLRAAARRLADDRVNVRVLVVGDIETDALAGIEARGKLDHAGIAAEFARADCLVLPSRCDAFGLVVAEALGSGLGAIVSEHVGAKDLVRESGAGWVVAPADVDALAERMRWCVEHPQAVLEAKQKARAAAPSWTWERYRTRVADTVLGLLEGAAARG
jgi:glycosyltransferase involved in cell wall biosynthesis